MAYGALTSAEKRSYIMGNKCALSFDLAQTISPEARIYNEAFALQQKLKQQPSLSRADRMSLVLRANSASLPVLRNIIAEIRTRPLFYTVDFPFVAEVTESGKLIFQETPMTNALNQLESLIESDFRIGYFPLYIEQILLMDALSQNLSVPGMSLEHGKEFDVISQFYQEHLVRLDKGLLALPWANEFSLEEFLFTMTRGTYPLGIASDVRVYFDGLFLGDDYYHSRHYFWRHDLAHLSLIAKFLLLPESSWQKRLILKIEQKIGMMNDLEMSEFLPVWFYWFHESALLYQLATFTNPYMGLNSYFQVHDKDLLIKRFNRPYDLINHVPKHIGATEKEISEYVLRIDKKIRALLMEIVDTL